jgi:redox-sensitive bicupin YhaK (pirin superfamily)
MDRKKFLTKAFLGTVSAIAGASVVKAKDIKENNFKQVGFNHLPNREETTMKTVLHKAETRGHANHGWLDSHHSFSFANYYNPERLNFGVLRVLNDDVVDAARGFGTHPHENMEIISIPLSGDLEHKDSMGNEAVIKQGDVQVLSAGTGIYHSEFNKNADKEVRFLQIWLFPNKKNVEPRYDQISIRDVEKKNQFYQVLSPNADDDGVWVHQDAWFHLGKFDKGISQTYSVKKSGNGVYAFILEGEVEIDGQKLSKRDGYGISDTENFKVKATSHAQILLMDIPMN